MSERKDTYTVKYNNLISNKVIIVQQQEPSETYTYRYYNNPPGPGTELWKTVEYESGATPSHPSTTPTKEGYTFDRWMNTGPSQELPAKVTYNMDWYALWTEKKVLDVHRVEFRQSGATSSLAFVLNSKFGYNRANPGHITPGEECEFTIGVICYDNDGNSHSIAQKFKHNENGVAMAITGSTTENFTIISVYCPDWTDSETSQQIAGFNTRSTGGYGAFSIPILYRRKASESHVGGVYNVEYISFYYHCASRNETYQRTEYISGQPTSNKIQLTTTDNSCTYTKGTW